ncbi:MAG: hypothetical protein Q8K55_11805 [Gemmatimonadaceae bacterium]|nr:hypothetical protein [Gemmatimonadaceae bacterium]
MLIINHPGAAVITTTEAKRDLPGTFKVAEKMRVYVTKDGQPIGGLVSLEMMALLEQALAEREERRAKRANWPVRVFKLGEEPDEDGLQTPEQNLAVMERLSRSAYAMRDAAAR